MYFCRYCSFSSNFAEILFRHLSVHSCEPGFSMQCRLCCQSFRNFSSYKSHVSRRHPGISAIDCCLTPSGHFEEGSHTPVESMEQSDATSSICEASNMMEDAPYEDSCATEHTEMQLDMVAAIFLATLKEKYKVTQSAVDYVVEGTTNLINRSIADHERAILCQLESYPSMAEQIKTSIPPYPVPLEKLKSAYLQTKFVEENFPFVRPIEIVLGEKQITETSGPQAGQLVWKKDKFVYVPILETIEALLNNKSILTEILSSHASTDGFLRDICDGEQGRESPFSEQSFLQILAYWDEVEVCNPLGSRVKKHKLGVFYFTLGNIRPACRSALKGIFLLAVVTSENLENYGFEGVLKPFITDITYLMNHGIQFEVCGQRKLFKGTLQLFLADTVAAHQIGGFKVGVGLSLRKCRHCMATFEQIQAKFRSDEFLLRTPFVHDYHCGKLTGPLRAHNSTSFGVNHTSILNTIPHFNVVNWQLPQDVMHVLLEGVVKNEVQLLLTTLIFDKRLFTLDNFNVRLESFQYGYSETTSKPSIIQATESRSLCFHQSASQSWLLARLLPLLIGDLVPDGDPHWNTYLLLHDILSHCMAPCISPATISYLTVLIELHHKTYRTTYPHQTMSPKSHYMTHFPEIIKRFGPLTRYWCMRMEAKNAYAKRAANSGNFKNICLSMANRHQRLQSIQLRDPSYFDDDYECGPGPDSKLITEEEPTISGLLRSKFAEISDDTPVFRPKWIIVNGTTYRPGCYVVHGFKNILPQFAVVKEVILLSGEPLLIVKCVQTINFSEHLRCYVIKNDEDVFKTLSIPELIDYYPLHAHTTYSQTDYNSYLCLKWNIEDITCDALV